MFHRLPVGAPHADHAQTQRTGTVISVSVVNPLMLENGWTFDDVFRVQPAIHSINMNFCISFIPRRSTLQRTSYCSRTVGQKDHTIVSNESAEIIRMFNTAFMRWARKRVITTHQPCKRKLTT